MKVSVVLKAAGFVDASSLYSGTTIADLLPCSTSAAGKRWLSPSSAAIVSWVIDYHYSDVIYNSGRVKTWLIKAWKVLELHHARFEGDKKAFRNFLTEKIETRTPVTDLREELHPPKRLRLYLDLEVNGKVNEMSLLPKIATVLGDVRGIRSAKARPMPESAPGVKLVDLTTDQLRRLPRSRAQQADNSAYVEDPFDKLELD